MSKRVDSTKARTGRLESNDQRKFVIEYLKSKQIS